MLRYARFALWVGLAAIPGITVALDPHPTQTKQAQNKQDKKVDTQQKAEAAQKDIATKDSDERIDRRSSRMKERNREIDHLLNQPKK